MDVIAQLDRCTVSRLGVTELTHHDTNFAVLAADHIWRHADAEEEDSFTAMFTGQMVMVGFTTQRP